MDTSVNIGNLITLRTVHNRVYKGVLAYLDRMTLTVTLVDTVSEDEHFDIIIFRATDILVYEFVQGVKKEQQGVACNKKKHYKKKISVN